MHAKRMVAIIDDSVIMMAETVSGKFATKL